MNHLLTISVVLPTVVVAQVASLGRVHLTMKLKKLGIGTTVEHAEVSCVIRALRIESQL